MAFVKKIIIFGIIVGICYVLMSYHFIFIGTSVKMLKKSDPTLKYTIFNTKGKKPEKILGIEELYNDGIGELLVEAGVISKERLELYKDKLEQEKYSKY